MLSKVSSRDSSPTPDKLKQDDKGAKPKQNITNQITLETFIEQQQNFNSQFMMMQQQMLSLMTELTNQNRNPNIPPPPPPPPHFLNNPSTSQVIAPPHRRISPVSKWNIQKFSGERKYPSVNEFITKVEMFAESDQLSNEEIAQSAVHLFEGTALHWYSGLHRQLTSIVPGDRWAEIKRNLKKDFLPADYDFRLTSQIENRLQGPDEPFSVYMAAMQFLFDQKAVPYQEPEKLMLIRRNMRPSYLSQLTFEQITTLDVLKDKCREIDKTEALVKRHNKMFPIPYAEPSFQYRSKQRNYTSRRVEEIEECNSVSESSENDDDDEAVEAISPSSKPLNKDTAERKRGKKVKECFNCAKEGHYFKECPEKRKEFCHRCGCPGVKAADCRKCRTPLGN